MTHSSIIARATRGTEAAGADTHTLSGEHAILLRDVNRRVAPVLALLGTRAWPHAELGALIEFLRASVLRQVSDEETVLYPPDASAPPFAELNADHVRLHALTAELEAAHARPHSPAELRVLVDDLLHTLRTHLVDEQAVLASLAHNDITVPSAAELAATRHGWSSDEDSPVRILLDTYPVAQATDLCVERLLRLRPGQSAEVHAHEGWQLREVRRWLQNFDTARFCVERATIGADHVLRIVCRQVTTTVGVAYPG